MIYLSGVIRQDLHSRSIGFMNTPAMRNVLPPDAIWAADNGRFSAPQNYSDAGYIDWLAHQPKRRCLFATAPDVLADHSATVQLSRPMLPRLRALGYPAAFVAQDGRTEASTPWPEFDVLFVGGTTGFKLGLAAAAIEAALRRGKKVHMGRVNSYKRLRVAALLGCASADGTFLRFAPDRNELRMLGWLKKLSAQPTLELATPITPATHARCF